MYTIPTLIGGVALIGDGDVTNHHGYCSGCEEDFWVVKLDQSGNIQWEQAYGASRWDIGVSISQVSDGGYIAAGYTASTDSDVIGNHGATDAWILRLDSTGGVIWKNCYGGTLGDGAQSIIEAVDGGYVFAGYTDSNDGDVSGNHGDNDAWIVKLNSAGVLQWQKCLGGSGFENANDIKKTSDNGFIISGSADSFDGDVTGNHGSGDFWIVKIDSIGNILWQKCLGGSDYEEAYEVRLTPDNGYVAIGETSSNDGDVSGLHTPCNLGLCSDYWVVKLAPVNTSVMDSDTYSDFQIHFNSASQTLTVRTFSKENIKVEIQIFDVTGRMLLQQNLSLAAGLNRMEIPAGDFESGIYLARLSTEAGALTKKLVVE